KQNRTSPWPGAAFCRGNTRRLTIAVSGVPGGTAESDSNGNRSTAETSSRVEILHRAARGGETTMTAWIDPMTAIGAAWSAWLGRVCWQAAVVVAAAWVLALVCRNWSPRLRSWIWRLAYLKLLVLLVWTTPVKLSLLPAAEETGARAQESEVSAAPERRQSTD